MLAGLAPSPEHPVNLIPILASHKILIRKLRLNIPRAVKDCHLAVIKVYNLLKGCRRILDCDHLHFGSDGVFMAELRKME